jgi:hypothetical protein
MNMGNYEAAIHLDPSTDSSRPSRELRRWWSGITTLVVVAIFTQAIFAGLMLSGVDWGRTAHSVNAAVLIAATLSAGLAALITLRRITHGPKLALTLIALAVVIFFEAAVGTLSAKGANLMWVHVPLGVALVGFAAQAAAGARRLGRDDL